MIVFQNVSKKYGAKTVLDNIHFSIPGGEFVSIMGPSGAGKSTIIKLLIGAEKPDVGKISVDGYEIQSMSKKILQHYRRKLGIVFQDYKLLPNKNVYENIAFAMEVCGESEYEIRKKVPKLLEIVGLAHHGKHFPHQLSGGESQRVALARALVHNPRLLIADEPTGNLDAENAAEIVKLLLKLHHHGVTVILATHDREIVNFINKRVIRISEGKITSDIKMSAAVSPHKTITTPSVNDIVIEEQLITKIHIE